MILVTFRGTVNSLMVVEVAKPYQQVRRRRRYSISQILVTRSTA